MEQPKKILVIEDNQEVRENLEEVLELYGYQVFAAADGIEGVKMAIDTAPDLILCDVMMPGLDGFGVLNILNKNETTVTTPFIFLTARTEKEDVRHGMKLGADDYITKPFYKDELLQVLETRLKKAALIKASSGENQSGFNQLNDPARGFKMINEAIDQADRRIDLPKRTVLVREGEYARFIYRVEAGSIHLRRSHEYGKTYILRTLSKGDFFGLASLLEQAPFPYSAQAAGEDSRLSMLASEDFLQLLNQDSNVAAAVMRLLAGVVIEDSEHLVNQAYDTVRRRTALVLCDLLEKHEGQPFSIQREDLAQMVGSTKESIIRSLSDFKAAGLIAIQGRKLEILNPDKLQNLMV